MKHTYKSLFKIALIAVVAIAVGTSRSAAQAINTYSFTPTSGTFTPLVGGTATSLAATVDGGMATAFPIGFTFTFGGVNYTTVQSGSDGTLLFGTGRTNSLTNNLATTTLTQRPGVAALWDDLQLTSGVTYQTSGAAGSQVLTVQWLNVEWNWSSNVQVISFQVKLYEGTNAIEIVYRQEAAAGNPAGSGGASIGIMGAPATDYISLQNATAVPTTSTTASTNNISTKPATGQIYRFEPPSACSGTPAVGNTLASVNPACANQGFTLSFSGGTAVGYSYQWQNSTNGSTYNNIAGATNATYSVTQSATTWYQVVVTCVNGGASATSTPVQVTMNTLLNCYCVPTYASGGANDVMTNVVLQGECSTLSNNSGTAQASPYYYYYTTPPATNTTTLYPGSTYTLSITYGSDGNQYGAAWIDYNLDGNLDASENLGITGDADANGTNTITFTVPVGATTGVTRLRIRGGNDSQLTAAQACGVSSSGFGQTEDYNITISAPVACTGTPSPGNTISSVSIACVNTPINLSVQNTDCGTGITYQWQSGPSNTGPWNDIIGATNSTATTTQTAATWYRLQATCAGTGTSTPVQVTQDVVANCYCLPSYSNGNAGFNDNISHVVMNTLDNTSGTTTAPGYTYFTTATLPNTVTTTLDIGSQYTISITMGSDGAQYATAWIDYNIDGAFTGAENLGISGDVDAGGTATFTFTVPTGAIAGLTRLRVRGGDDVALTSAMSCGASASTFGEAEDYDITLVQLPDCSGTVTGGTTNTSDATPCSNIPFLLSVSGSSAGTVAGLQLQWQVANSASGPWTDVATATAQSYSATQAGAITQHYRRRIICPATPDTAYSTTLTATTTICYCVPTYSTGTGSGIFIDAVTTDNAGIANTSGASATPYYNDYSGTITPGSVYAGSFFWLNVANGTGTGTQYVHAWVDWNGDGDFGDAGEKISWTSGATTFTYATLTGGGQTAHLYAAVPNIAGAITAGTKRLRIRISTSTTTTDCGTATTGEAEDYSLTLLPSACSTPTVASNIQSVSPNFTTTNDAVTVTIAPGGVGFLKRWEFSFDNFATAPAGSFIQYPVVSGNIFYAQTTQPFIYFRAVYQNEGCAEAFTSATFVKINCATVLTTMSGSGDYIDLVKITDPATTTVLLNNVSSFDPPKDGYQDFRSISVELDRKKNYTMDVSMDATFDKFVAVWLDQDGDDVLTTTELLYNSTTQLFNHTFTINIPCNTTGAANYSGPARMRVYVSDINAIPNDPCAATTLTWGEIEEYTVIINPLQSLTVTPSNAVCQGVQNTLTVSGGTGSYTWTPTTGLVPTSGATVVATTGGTPVFYTVSGALANLCISSAVVPVASTPSGGTIAPLSKVVCNNGSQLFTATGAAGNLNWQTAPSPAGPWTDIVGATNATYNLTGITTTTYVRLIARTVACWDVASSTSVVSVSATPVVTLTNVTNNSVTVSWSPFGAGDYTVNWTGAAGTGTQAAATSPFTITGLTAGSALTVTVTKTSTPSCAGTSPGNASTTTLCAKPTVSSVTAVVSPTGVKGLKVIWTAVAGATAYRVYYRPLVMNANWSSVDTAGGTTKTIMPLYAGVPYAVMVAANNCPGAGQLGQPSDVNYFTYTAPGLPACGPVPTITAVSNCPNQLTANLSGGTGTWRVTARRLSPSFSAGVSYTVSSPVVNLSITATPTGSVWEVFAQAVCGSSYSGLSNVEVVTVKAPCLAPQNVVVSHPDCDGFTVAWNPAVCGGLTLSNYQVYIKKSTAVNYVSYNGGSGDHKTFPYPALAPGTYTVFVRAITCNGSMSAASTVETGVVGGPGCKTGDEETTEATEAVVAASIYPNPTAGQFSVEVTATSKNEALRIEVADALGRVVYTDLSDTEAGLPSLRVLNLPESMSAGLYTVRIAAGQNTWTERLVLQRD